MKTALFILVSVTVFAACKTKIDEPAPTGIQGGKGGNYAVAVFPVSDTMGVHGVCYIKYAADRQPVSSKDYNDSSATMVEPGFGPHAHFLALKEGSYAISARSVNKKLHGDTILEIKAGDPANIDFQLQMK